jgi:carboxylesterase type B
MQFHNQRRSLSDLLIVSQKKSLIPNKFHFNLPVQWTPVVDGDEFAGQPQDLMEAGRIHDVPILLGYNRDEASFVLAVLGTILRPIIDNPLFPIVNEKVYRMLARRVFREAAEEVHIIFIAIFLLFFIFAE